MPQNTSRAAGRHFLQIPGPTPLPDRVLMVETGQFATQWKTMAEKLGLKPEFIKGDWRTGADAAVIEEHLRKDKGHEIKAVCVVHNETSTGATSRIDEVRRAINAAKTVNKPRTLTGVTCTNAALNNGVPTRGSEWNRVKNSNR